MSLQMLPAPGTVVNWTRNAPRHPTLAQPEQLLVPLWDVPEAVCSLLEALQTVVAVLRRLC